MIDQEKLVAEIRALREAALRFARIADTDTGDIGGAWTELEAAAVAYVRKLDDETRAADKGDYLAIFEEGLRDRDKREN